MRRNAIERAFAPTPRTGGAYANKPWFCAQRDALIRIFVDPAAHTPTRIDSSGESFVVMITRVDNRTGITYVEQNSLVTGTATDSNGASYMFNYHQHLSTQIPPGGFPMTANLTDHFNLVGNGQANQMQRRGRLATAGAAVDQRRHGPRIVAFVRIFDVDPVAAL